MHGSTKIKFVPKYVRAACICSGSVAAWKQGKSKAVSLQAWSGPEGSRKLRFPDFMTTAQVGGKVVSLTYRPPLPSTKYPWYSFLLEAESTPGPQCDRKDFMSMAVTRIEPAIF